MDIKEFKEIYTQEQSRLIRAMAENTLIISGTIAFVFDKYIVVGVFAVLFLYMAYKGVNNK